MYLSEQHIIRTNEWREWCVKAKELYNQTLYYWRQSVFGNIEYFSENEIIKLYREYNEPTFKVLPSHCGQEVIKNLYDNIKGWQKARKEYRINPKNFFGPPRMPKFKKELSVLGFDNNQIRLKDGYIHFPKMIGIDPIKTRIKSGTKLRVCRVIPKSNHFVVEFIYEVQEKPVREYNGKALGIDLGMNNLVSCITTTSEGFLINGKVLKSINQNYNKKKAKLQSLLPTGTFLSKRINKITFNRKNKIENYLHHTSKYIVEKAKELDITKIVIGNNKNWKQDINLGKRTNQNFVSLPHSYLIEKIEYKARLAGIEVLKTEESYTSKCSALDLEPICKHENYLGKRAKRGLFITANGTKINADANGATNILRKVIGDSFLTQFNKRCVVQPSKINLFEQNRIKSKTLSLN